MDDDIIKVDIIINGCISTRRWMACGAGAHIVPGVLELSGDEIPEQITHEGKVYDCSSAIIINAGGPNGVNTVDTMFVPHGRTVLVTGFASCLGEERVNPHWSEGNVTCKGVTPQQPYEPAKTQLYGHTFDGTGDTSD